MLTVARKLFSSNSLAHSNNGTYYNITKQKRQEVKTAWKIMDNIEKERWKTKATKLLEECIQELKSQLMEKNTTSEVDDDKDDSSVDEPLSLPATSNPNLPSSSTIQQPKTGMPDLFLYLQGQSLVNTKEKEEIKLELELKQGERFFIDGNPYPSYYFAVMAMPAEEASEIMIIPRTGPSSSIKYRSERDIFEAARNHEMKKLKKRGQLVLNPGFVDEYIVSYKIF